MYKIFAEGMKRRHLFLLLISGLFLLSSCSKDRYEVFSGYAQGGTYTVKANLSGVKVSHEEIASKIDSMLRQIDFSISGYNKNSILSRRNRGEDVAPDSIFTDLMRLSELYSEQTAGAFSVTAAPLFDLWGFGFKSGEFPLQEQIDRALAQSKEGKILNFNAIAQGYSCDLIASYLYSIGVKDMLVDIGEIYCDGLNPSAKGWAIGVDEPFDGNDTPGAKLNSVWRSGGGPCGIVTSGNYRKFYIRDGKKYAHTIDPQSGRPVEHNLLSATIVAPTAAQADAYATACMVMGPDKAREFIENQEGIEGLLICADSTWASEGFNIER